MVNQAPLIKFHFRKIIMNLIYSSKVYDKYRTVNIELLVLVQTVQ